MNKYVPLLKRCRVATNNANAAQLLYRIAFWMPKAKIVHGGLKWSANSAAQWCEQTGLSFDQYRRAIALLKTLGLVKTEQHIWFGKTITHVRITDLGWAAIGKHPLDQGTAASPASANPAQPDKCESAQLYIQGDSSLETHHGDSNIALASTHAIISHLENKVTGKQRHKSNSSPDSKEGNSNPVSNESSSNPESNEGNSNPVSKKESTIQINKKYENDSGSPQINSQGAGASIHPPNDILAPTESPAPSSAISIARPVPVLQSNKTQGASPADLADLWKVLIVEKYGDYVPQFTKKEFGQLKDFIRACPPGQAVSFLECCLRDWDGFTGYAKANYGAFPLSARPTLDFLLKYRVGAVNFARDEAKEAAKKAAKHQAMLDTSAKKLTVVPPFESTVKKPPPEDVPATLEEVLAILNEGTTTDEHQAMLNTNAKTMTVDHPLKATVKKPTPDPPKLTYEEVLALINNDDGTTADDN